MKQFGTAFFENGDQNLVSIRVSEALTGKSYGLWDDCESIIRFLCPTFFCLDSTH